MAYEPFGPEWEKEMMRFTKKGLIVLLRTQQEKDNPQRVCECFSPSYLLGPCINCGGSPRLEDDPPERKMMEYTDDEIMKLAKEAGFDDSTRYHIKKFRKFLELAIVQASVNFIMDTSLGGE